MPKSFPLLPFPELLKPELQQTLAVPDIEPMGPPDAPARAQALNIRRSFVVEAPAGSGKTGLLIQRFLKLLADISVTAPEQVLAITFTLKATAELRDRVLAHLEAARTESEDATRGGVQGPGFEVLTSATGTPGLDSQSWDLTQSSFDQPLRLAAAAATPADSPSFFTVQTRTLAQAVLARDRQLGWSLLDHPHRLNIRTIDSVCAHIAQTLPVLSGSGGHLSPAADAEPLCREAARRTLPPLGSDRANSANRSFDDSLRDLLLHRDGNLADCETLLADMLAIRDQWGSLIWGDLIPLDPAALDDAWLNANVLPRLQRTLELAICAELTRLTSLIDKEALADLTLLAADMANAGGYRGEPSPIAICKGRNDSPGERAQDLEHWQALIHLLIKPSKPRGWRKGVSAHIVKFEIEKHHEAQLKRIIARLSDSSSLVETLCRIEALPPAKYPPGQWSVAKSLFRVLSRALVELQFVFAERGQCDFPELSLLARSALHADTGPDDLAAALGARIQHLLVDEMQDTSAAQYDLVQLLTASWDGHSQTVFLVGDPRQSIYLFRQARVEGFLQMMQTLQLGDLRLTRLSLTANFRSQETLVKQFNQDFGLIFPTSSSETLPYADAVSTLPESPHSSGLNWHAHPVEIRPAPQPGAPLMAHADRDIGGVEADESSEAAPNLTPAQHRQGQSRRDANQIRQIARRWLSKPLPADRAQPWRIAVLVRNRSHLAEVVAAFEKSPPLPYRAVDITPLNERQEVLDLTALTRTLLHPADRVAALAVLRAPWCGLPLAALHTLTGADLDAPALKHLSIQRLIADRSHLLDPDSVQRLARVSTVLEAARSLRGRLTPAQLVERAWRSLGGDASLSPGELINARRFFQLLDELAAETGTGRIDPTHLAGRLRYLYAEPASTPSGQPFVELLTIHTAKGLEWDAVIVPALERGGGFSRQRFLTWSELDLPSRSAANEPPLSTSKESLSETWDLAPGTPGAPSPEPSRPILPSPIMLAPIAAKGEPIDALTTWLKEIQKKREAAERKRVFYVAATRAREELHLFVSPDLVTSGNINPRWDSLLKAVLPAAQPHLDAAIAAKADSQSGAPSFSAPSESVASSSDARNASFPNSPESLVLDDLAAAATIYQMPLRNQVPTPTSAESSLDPLPNAPLNPPIQRLPLAFDPSARLLADAERRLPYEEASAKLARDPSETQLKRPEGSFAARALGNAVHAFLELLATRIATGQSSAGLLAELPSWTPRIAAILRADGLPPVTVERLTRETRVALANTLRDPDGLWLLASHPGAASELALTGWTDHQQAKTIRVDRTFQAGPDPRTATPGQACLWIVDYKTAAHGPSGLDAFLQTQRAIYAPQLEAYAAVLAPAQSIPPNRIRLALYYPAIPKLIWWPPRAD